MTRFLCKICHGLFEATDPRYLICFDCFQMLGQPANGEQLNAALHERPALVRELIRAGRI